MLDIEKPQDSGIVEFCLYNTFCRVTIMRADADVQKLLRGAQEIARRVRRMIDIYDSESELSRLCSGYEPMRPIRVSAGLFNFIARMKTVWSISGGAFDPACGALMRLWDFTAEQPQVPSETEISRCRESAGFDAVILNSHEQTVCFTRLGVELDGGAAGKGYAVECVAKYLRNSGVRSASVNFGGNICVIGNYSGIGAKHRWRVALQTPWRPRGDVIGSLEIEDLSVSTSGGYDRFFEKDGELYHHLLDPRTGSPVKNGLLSVTVVCADAWLADMLSTAIFIAGTAMADELVRRIDSRAGYVLIERGEKITVSDNLKGSFKIYRETNRE